MFVGLEIIRLLSSLAVAYAHRANNYSLLPHGHYGVDIFFVLSGIVLAKYFNQKSPINWKLFLFGRFIRIVPMYWIVTCVAVMYYLYVKKSPNVSSLFHSFFFLGGVNEKGIIEPILPVGWTLHFEWIFYLSIVFWRNKIIFYFFIALALWWNEIYSFYYAYFFVGVLIGSRQGLIKNESLVTPWRATAFIVLCAFLFLMLSWVQINFYKDGYTYERIFLFGPLILTIILSNKLLGQMQSWPEWVGGASFIVYLIHQPIYKMLDYFGLKYGIYAELFIIGLIGIIVSFVERPIRLWIIKNVY